MAMGLSTPALAAETLTVVPAGAWVMPVVVPEDDGKGGDAAVKILLNDEQVDLQPGRITHYLESVYKLQTTQGLAAGAVAFAWDPAIQTVTVHKLHIRRGAQVIDVLAGGQTFTVIRREANLENAVLDGQLTASIQPEGLQVGDIVDLSLSLTSADPAIGQHVEATGAMWNGAPMRRVHFRAQWPAAVPMRIAPNGGLALPKILRKGGLSSVEIGIDQLEPPVLPNGAPQRYRLGRMLEMTDLASWSGLVGIMAPLFVKAEVIPAGGAVAAEIAKIRALSPDPKKRAEAALALVQARVRYVALSLDGGGLVPAQAETTWSRRFGDCKGKTVLLLAMLHALGIQAEAVLVNTQVGDGMDKRLPALGLFNHVLVRATLGGRIYWLDGTRVGDLSLDRIETPNLHWGLPLVPGTTALVPMVPAPYQQPQLEVAIRIDATGGLTLPAPIHIERTIRGDEALGTSLALANLTGASRQQALRQFWKGRYDFAEPTSFSTSFDADTREMHMGMDGTTKMDWNEGWYEADHVWVGFKADFSRDPGSDTSAPYAVDYPAYSRVVETILLPPGTGTFAITPGSDVNETVAGRSYSRHATLTGDRFEVESVERSLAPEFPAAQAAAAEASLRAMAKKSVTLKSPANYTGSAAERAARDAAVLASQPTTAKGLVAKAALLLQKNKADAALVELDKAIAIDPKSIAAYSLRTQVRLTKEQPVEAKADLDRAIALDPNAYETLWARANYGMRRGDYADAAAAYSAMLRDHPDDVEQLANRARAYNAAQQNDLAMIDAAAVLKQQPSNAGMHVMRANILRQRDDDRGAAQEAEALMVDGADSKSMVYAAMIYAKLGQHDAAMRAIDRALANKPDGYTYIGRYGLRAHGDIIGRQQDLDAAVRLAPDAISTIVAKAAFQGERGDWPGAVSTLSLVIAAHPDEQWLKNERGIAYAKMGNAAAAETDFAAARAQAKSVSQLNSLCWAKAIANVALDRAASECEAALALAPDMPMVRDSYALVLLRQGRVDAALGEYDKALAKTPTLATSLYGRALAYARKGDTAASARDAAAARKSDAQTADRFAGYGLSLGG